MLTVLLPVSASLPALQFGIQETELLGGAKRLMKDGVVDERWQEFMKFQIARARELFQEAEAGVDLLSPNARWPVWSALILYRQILDSIEENGYNNFNKRAYVPKWRKLASLPAAFAKAALPQLNPGYQAAMAAGAIRR
jgi:phytoene synthase